MFKFWNEFIPKATSVIELGQGQIYYEKIVKPQLHSYMATVFEDMCRRYTLEQGIAAQYGNFITKTGMWWGTENVMTSDGKRISQSADIDVVGILELDKTAVIGECKFKNEKIDKGVYETLVRRAKMINPKYNIIKYLFFSLSGYTEWFENLQDDMVEMLTLEDLYAEEKNKIFFEIGIKFQKPVPIYITSKQGITCTEPNEAYGRAGL